MRAFRLDGHQLRLVSDAPDPVLAAGEALVHPTRLLISAADVLPLEARSAGVPGHQFVGIVKKINLPADPPPTALLAAKKALLNKRVVGSPLIACTNCDLCRAGLPGHCRARRVMGLHMRDGCAADLFAIPLANLCSVPDAVSDDHAVFAHLAGSAVQAAQMLRAASRHFITVIGDSPLALATAQVLLAQNKTTRLLHTQPDRARLCERWGMRHRELHEPGRRQDQDVVVDCTGTPDGLTLAMQLVRPRGVIMLKSPVAGVPFPPGQPYRTSAAWTGPDARRVDLTPAITNELQILGCREASIVDGLGAIIDGRVDAAALIGKRFKFDDITAAFEAAADSAAMATVVTM